MELCHSIPNRQRHLFININATPFSSQTLMSLILRRPMFCFLTAKRKPTWSDSFPEGYSEPGNMEVIGLQDILESKKPNWEKKAK